MAKESLYDIPHGCICMGDGLFGMKCPAAEHARLKEPSLPAGPSREDVPTLELCREIKRLEVQNADLSEIARLIGSIFFYGSFKAETYNERELEKLLRKTGFFCETEAQVLALEAIQGRDTQDLR